VLGRGIRVVGVSSSESAERRMIDEVSVVCRHEYEFVYVFTRSMTSIYMGV
jgi:hypothetical protein